MNLSGKQEKLSVAKVGYQPSVSQNDSNLIMHVS